MFANKRWLLVLSKIKIINEAHKLSKPESEDAQDGGRFKNYSKGFFGNESFVGLCMKAQLNNFKGNKD